MYGLSLWDVWVLIIRLTLCIIGCAQCLVSGVDNSVAGTSSFVLKWIMSSSFKALVFKLPLSLALVLAWVELLSAWWQHQCALLAWLDVAGMLGISMLAAWYARKCFTRRCTSDSVFTGNSAVHASSECPRIPGSMGGHNKSVSPHEAVVAKGGPLAGAANTLHMEDSCSWPCGSSCHDRGPCTGGQLQQQQHGACTADGIDSAYALAYDLVDRRKMAYVYTSDIICHRLALKIPDAEPTDLPEDWQLKLVDLLQSRDEYLLGAYVRPGCIQLLLEVAAAAQDDPQAAEAHGSPMAVQEILGTLGPSLNESNVTVQTSGQVSYLGDGNQNGGATGTIPLPDVGFVSPVCIVSSSSSPAELFIAGSNMQPFPEVQCFARFHGQYVQNQAELLGGHSLQQALTRHPALAAVSSRFSDVLRIAVNVQHCMSGLMLLECQRTHLLGNSGFVLLVESEEMATEILSLEHQFAAGPAAMPVNIHHVLMDLGRWLDFCSSFHTSAAYLLPEPGQPPATPLEDHLTEPDLDSASTNCGHVPSEYDSWQSSNSRSKPDSEFGSDGSGEVEASMSALHKTSGEECSRPGSGSSLGVHEPAAPVVGPSHDSDALRVLMGRIYSDPALKEHVLNMGVRLLVFACTRGWPATADCLLKGLISCGGLTMEQVNAKAVQAEGMTLQHLAVRSGTSSMVQKLLSWRSTFSCELDMAVPGPFGLTPLHLAAVLPDAGAVARMLLSQLSLCDQWLTARCQDGSTPALLAGMAGLHNLNAMAASHMLAYAEPPGAALGRFEDDSALLDALSPAIPFADSLALEPSMADVPLSSQQVLMQGWTGDAGWEEEQDEQQEEHHQQQQPAVMSLTSTADADEPWADAADGLQPVASCGTSEWSGEVPDAPAANPWYTIARALRRGASKLVGHVSALFWPIEAIAAEDVAATAAPPTSSAVGTADGHSSLGCESSSRGCPSGGIHEDMHQPQWLLPSTRRDSIDTQYYSIASWLEVSEQEVQERLIDSLFTGAQNQQLFPLAPSSYPLQRPNEGTEMRLAAGSSRPAPDASSSRSSLTASTSSNVLLDPSTRVPCMLRQSDSGSAGSQLFDPKSAAHSGSCGVQGSGHGWGSTLHEAWHCTGEYITMGWPALDACISGVMVALCLALVMGGRKVSPQQLCSYAVMLGVQLGPLGLLWLWRKPMYCSVRQYCKAASLVLRAALALLYGARSAVVPAHMAPVLHQVFFATISQPWLYMVGTAGGSMAVFLSAWLSDSVECLVDDTASSSQAWGCLATAASRQALNLGMAAAVYVVTSMCAKQGAR